MSNSRPWLDAMNRYHYSARCTLHAYKCIHVRDERVTCGSKNEHNKRHFSRWFVLFSFCIKLFRFQAVIKLWTILENYRIREHFAAMNEIRAHILRFHSLLSKIEYGFLLFATVKKIPEQRGRLKELQLIVFQLFADFKENGWIIVDCTACNKCRRKFNHDEPCDYAFKIIHCK